MIFISQMSPSLPSDALDPSYNSGLRNLVILFARAPVAGRVKTRLATGVGAETAARLHRAFVRDVAARAAVQYPIELHLDEMTPAWPELDCPRRLQVSGDLGVRMRIALGDALAQGFERVAVLGTDAPDLPAAHLDDLFTGDSDVRLGPAEDGGFWGICCRRIVDTMFNGVPWSSARTLERTQAACLAAGLCVSLGRRWADVDEPADLKRLAASLSLDPAGPTASELRKLRLLA
jgi:rSAM/selenodomain-associated transferase 1